MGIPHSSAVFADTQCQQVLVHPFHRVDVFLLAEVGSQQFSAVFSGQDRSYFSPFQPKTRVGSHRDTHGTKVMSMSIPKSTRKKGSIPFEISSMERPLMADATKRE